MINNDERNYAFSGIHILGEIEGIDGTVLNDLNYFIYVLNKGIENTGATIHGTLVKKFDSGGVTILILLSESHVSVHTYPEHNSFFYDIFTCGTSCNPEKFIDCLSEHFKAANHSYKQIRRGENYEFNK